MPKRDAATLLIHMHVGIPYNKIVDMLVVATESTYELAGEALRVSAPLINPIMTAKDRLSTTDPMGLVLEKRKSTNVSTDTRLLPEYLLILEMQTTSIFNGVLQ